jgi:hypothetical protein
VGLTLARMGRDDSSEFVMTSGNREAGGACFVGGRMGGSVCVQRRSYCSYKTPGDGSRGTAGRAGCSKHWRRCGLARGDEGVVEDGRCGLARFTASQGSGSARGRRGCDLSPWAGASLAQSADARQEDCRAWMLPLEDTRRSGAANAL